MNLHGEHVAIQTTRDNVICIRPLLANSLDRVRNNQGFSARPNTNTVLSSLEFRAQLLKGGSCKVLHRVEIARLVKGSNAFRERCRVLLM